MENRKAQYLKYAFGEIVLVVVGILIALQINNWNENRKHTQNEEYILNEILNNLQEDKMQIEEIVLARQKTQNSVEDMLVYLKEDTLNTNRLFKDMANYLTFERYYTISNAYEMMKSTGLKISNNALRTLISRYYDFEQNKLSSSVLDIEEAFEKLMDSDGLIRTSLGSMQKGERVELIDPNNQELKNALHNRLVGFKDNNDGTLNKLLVFKIKNQELIDAIKAELKIK